MNVDLFSDRLKEYALAAGFSLDTYGTVGEVSLPVLTRKGSVADPLQVYMATGVHGDEPAGPMAVLELLRDQQLPSAFSYTIFPCINPDGLRAGTRTNAAGLDLNRDYSLDPQSYETRVQVAWIGDQRFDIALCLHEDSDGEGFYLYAHQAPGIRTDLPFLALEAAKPFTGIDLRTEIDDMPAVKGLMQPPAEIADPKRPDLPEALRMHHYHGCKVTITTETPSGQLIADRVKAQTCVVREVLAQVQATGLGRV